MPLLIVVWVVSIAVVCLLVEAATRVHHSYKYGYRSPAQQELYGNEATARNMEEDIRKRRHEAYPYVMYRQRPNQHFNTININGWGFRGKEITKEKPANTTRIVVLGGSAAWGTGATSDATTLSGQLEKRLNDASSSSRYEVINAGEPGYQTAQEFIAFWDRLLDFSPDVVLTFDGYNDMYAGFTNEQPGFPLNFRELYGAKLEGELWACLVEPVQRVTSNSLFIEKIVDKVRLTRGRRLQAQDAEFIRSYVDPAATARMFGRNLEYMHVLAKDRGVKTLFTLQPVLGFGTKPMHEIERTILEGWELRIPGYMAYLSKVYPLLVAELARLEQHRGAPTLSLVDVFAEVHQRVYVSRVHVSDRGTAIVVDHIVKALTPLLPSRSGSPPPRPRA